MNVHIPQVDVFDGQFDNLLDRPDSIEDLIFDFPASLDEHLDGEMVTTEIDRRSWPTLQMLDSSPAAFAKVNDTYQYRFSYGIEQLKMAPESMLLANKTPWCHEKLYSSVMPQSMQDVLAACALYITRNSTNEGFVWRYITARRAELLSLPRPTEPLSLLSYTQALLLYQIMRVFGGNIQEQLRADTSMKELELAAHALSEAIDAHVERKQTLAYYPISANDPFWRSWILAESQRRTLLVTYYFLRAYAQIKDEALYCPKHRPQLCNMTASAHLWNANTLFDFTKAWNEKKHFVIGVTESDAKQLLIEAHADDIEDLTKIFLVAFMGIDDLRGWLHLQGSSN